MTDKLLRLTASCPVCDWRPSFRADNWLYRHAMRADPDQRIGTFACQKDGCGHVYPIYARHVQRATEDRRAA